MIDDLVIEVKRETETKIFRFWITVVDNDDVEMFKRRSVILGLGANTITLTWTNGRAGMAYRAVLFETAISTEILLWSHICGHPFIPDVKGGNSVTLIWEFNHKD